MRYLVDAQLPRRLKAWLVDSGFDAVHTLELLNRNATSDQEIIDRYISAEVVVISKDKDFPHQRMLRGKPENLLWITTGNIGNTELLHLFEQYFVSIHQSFEGVNQFIELHNSAIIVRE